jgi:hypothetical protein
VMVSQSWLQKKSCEARQPPTLVVRLDFGFRNECIGTPQTCSRATTLDAVSQGLVVLWLLPRLQFSTEQDGYGE